MIAIVNGNSLHIPLADNSVHCVVSSPPYWGLRDYGLKPSIWGGDPDCDHDWHEHIQACANGTVVGDMKGETLSTNSATRKPKKSNFCSRCGAWKGCYGLEPTPEMFVEHTVLICREVGRVLRPDGTLWLNLGDSYAGSGGVGNQRDDANKGNMAKFKNPNSIEICRSKRIDRGSGRWGGGNNPATGNLKPKDLVGIPWRVALALHADGWYLRSDIIWSKPNPMPESVTDRPTRSHEYLFLLTKSAKYYYDKEAICEPYSQASIERISQDNFDNQTGGPSDPLNGGEGTRNRSARQGLVGLRDRIHKNLQEDGQRPNSMHIVRAIGGGEPEQNSSGRNKRTVWDITLQPYSGAHFATYPPKLVEPCIKAGTSERGVCPTCGTPWRRVTKKGYRAQAEESVIAEMEAKGVPRQKANLYGAPSRAPENYADDPDSTLGWKPSCKCYGLEIIGEQPGKPSRKEKEGEEAYNKRRDAYLVELREWYWLWEELKPAYDACTVKPAIVFDPFSGSGTTIMVARALGRSGVGLDLSLKYILECAKERLGMSDLQEWMEGKKAEASDLSDLPMFAGMSV